MEYPNCPNIQSSNRGKGLPEPSDIENPPDHHLRRHWQVGELLWQSRLRGFTRSKIPKNRTGLLRGLRMFENFEMVWGQKVFEETCHQPSDFWSTCVPRCSMALMSFFPDLVIGSASTSAASHARHQNCKRLRWLRRSKIFLSRAPEPTPESQMHIRLWGNHKAAWHLRIRLRYMFKKGHSRQAKCLPSSNQIGVLIVFLPTVWLSQASLCHYSILCTKFEDKKLTEII